MDKYYRKLSLIVTGERWKQNPSGDSLIIIIRDIMESITELLHKLRSVLHVKVENLYYYARLKHSRDLLQDIRMEYQFKHSTVDRHYNKRPISILDRLVFVLLIMMIIRYMTTCFMLSTGRGRQYFDIDIVMEAVAQRTKMDNRSFMMLSIVFIYVLVIHWFRNYKGDWIILDRLYQTVVVNVDRFWAQNRQLPRPNYNSTSVVSNLYMFVKTYRATRRWIQKTKATPKTIQKLDYTFRWDRGPVELPELLQARLVCKLMIVEMINVTLVILIRIAILASIYGYVKYVRKTRPDFGPFLYFLVGLDRCVTMTIACLSIPHVFFFIFSMRLTSYVFTQKLARFNNRVETLVHQGKVARLEGYMPRYRQQVCLPKVLKYCFEHNQIASFLGHMNRKMVSWDVLFFGISQMPFNVYGITKLMLLGLGSTQIMIFLVLLIQLYVVLISAMPMMRINSTVVIWSKNLPNLIAFLFSPNPQSLMCCTKMKSQVFYETFNSGHHLYGFSIGPLGLVTRNVIVRFFLMYWAYTIFACGLIRKGMINDMIESHMPH